MKTAVAGILLLFAWGCIQEQFRQIEMDMQTPDVYEPVGHTLARYCQSRQIFFPEHLNTAWLPDELNAIGSGLTCIQTNCAHIEMGGGFHHFGYNLMRDPERSTSQTNICHLHMYSEDNFEKLLWTFPQAVTNRFTRNQILAKLTNWYDQHLTESPDDQ